MRDIDSRRGCTGTRRCRPIGARSRARVQGLACRPAEVVVLGEVAVGGCPCRRASVASPGCPGGEPPTCRRRRPGRTGPRRVPGGLGRVGREQGDGDAHVLVGGWMSCRRWRCCAARRRVHPHAPAGQTVDAHREVPRRRWTAGLARVGADDQYGPRRYRCGGGRRCARDRFVSEAARMKVAADADQRPTGSSDGCRSGWPALGSCWSSPLPSPVGPDRRAACRTGRTPRTAPSARCTVRRRRRSRAAR